MPARTHSWLIAASTPTPDAQAPAPKRSNKHAGRSKVLSTIVEVEEDAEEDLDSGSSAASWELARFISLEHASMVPQALLVDASTTLCAYLYFTSLQTRMAIQQQASLDILQTVCGSFPPDSNPSIMSVCAHAVAHHQELQESVVPSFISHHLIILAVVLKALFGFSILKFAGKYVKPFDYLVASGAAHCLLLYCFLFAPVANLLENIAGADNTLLYTVASKVVCILLVGAAFGFMHHIAVVQRASSRAVALPIAENEPLLSEKSAECFA